MCSPRGCFEDEISSGAGGRGHIASEACLSLHTTNLPTLQSLLARIDPFTKAYAGRRA